MRMYVAGQWVETEKKIEVLNPYDGSVVDTVPRADLGDVDRALESAVRGAKTMARLPGYDRYRILKRAADLIEARTEEFARTLTLEEGKSLAESRFEVSRAVQTLTLSGEEAKRLHGETIPLDGAPGGAGKLAFTLRVPCGVVVAITPFNFLLNLVCHKVGPALAAGNAVVLKPAEDTPLSAIKLTEVLLEAGLPADGIACLTGLGEEIGDALTGDRRVRKITFTGSREVGERICHVAGIKKVTMELGSNSAVIVMPDADLEKVATAVAATGYSNAGQVCISTQRVLTSDRIYSDFLDALTPRVAALTTGNPLDQRTKVGPMIKEKEAIRVEEWVREAAADGRAGDRGRAAPGGHLCPHGRRRRQARDADLLRRAVRSGRGGHAVRVARRGDPACQRLDLRSCGRHLHRESGVGDAVCARGRGGQPDGQLGSPMARRPDAVRRAEGERLRKEGPRYAVEEMTELKLVCFHLGSS